MISRPKLDDCSKRFAKETNILAVWFLGSAAKNRTRSNSDVDFAVLHLEDTVGQQRLNGNLIANLESILEHPVDLGRTDTQNLIYAHQAISEGQLVYDGEPARTNQFVEKVLALYFDLKQDRKVVENAYCV